MKTKELLKDYEAKSIRELQEEKDLLFRRMKTKELLKDYEAKSIRELQEEKGLLG